MDEVKTTPSETSAYEAVIPLHTFEPMYFMQDKAIPLKLDEAKSGSKQHTHAQHARLRVLQARAEWSFHIGKYREAIANFEAILGQFDETILRKYYLELYEGLFHSWMALKEFLDAEKYSLLLLDHIPSSKDVAGQILFLSATVSYKLSKLEYATEQVQNVIQKNNYHLRAWWLMCKLLFKLGRCKLCGRAIERTVRLTRRDNHSQYAGLKAKCEALRLKCISRLEDKQFVNDNQDKPVSDIEVRFLSRESSASVDQDNISDSDDEDDVLKVEMM